MSDKKETQINLHDVLDAIPASVYIKNIQGHYIFCNRYMMEMVGISRRDDIIGKSDAELPWQKIADKLRETDKRVMSQNEVMQFEEAPNLHDGSQRTFLSSKTPLMNGKTVAGLIGASIDISAKKQLSLYQNSLKRQEAVLLSMVNEFRSLLQVIIPSLDLIQQASLLENQLQAVNDIRAACEESHNTLMRASASAKLESGSLALLMRPLKLIDFIIHAIQENNHVLRKNTECFIQIAEDTCTPIVLGDGEHLIQILSCLLSHIYSHTTASLISVEIKHSSKEKTGSLVIIDKESNISEDIFDKLFSTQALESSLWGDSVNLMYCQKFIKKMNGSFTVTRHKSGKVTYTITLTLSTTTPQEKINSSAREFLYIDSNKERSNLFQSYFHTPPEHIAHTLSELKNAPLSSHSIVFIHDSDIIFSDCLHYLTSKQITTIILTHKIITQTPTDTQLKFIHSLQTPISPREVNTLIEQLNKRKRLLIVDDAYFVRRALARIFTSEGYEVECAESGEDAIAMVRAHHTGIIMDIGMPGLNGIETAKIIKAQFKNQAPLIIALTGETPSISLDDIYEANCFSAVQLKGANFDTLISCADSLFNEAL